MKKKEKMFTFADITFTLICFATILCWYFKIPYRLEVTIGLGILAIIMLFFMRKGYQSEVEFLNQYTQLLQDEGHFRSAFDYTASGMALISKNGHFLKVNHSLCQILGFNENELLTKSIRKLMVKADFKKMLVKIREMSSGKTKIFQAINRYYNKQGDVILVGSSISYVHDKDNKPLYFVGQFQNILSKNSSQNNVLQDMAYTDSLTGLSNRNFLDQYLSEAIRDSNATQSKFAVILVDIDGLRTINDSLGHNYGDALLRLIAERIKHTVRGEDVVARIGGDEFALIIKNFNEVEIPAQISQKILSRILQIINLDNHEVHVSGSIGISIYPSDGQDIETLIKHADEALYKAKQNKGNNYQFFLQDMTEQAQKMSKQKSALNNAMAKNELQLYYQPCVSLKDQKVSSVEALIRWNSDQYNLVMPDKIIPLAEESGLIIPLSEWIIRTACKQIRAWQKKGHPDLKLSINISAYQFKNPAFTTNIIRAVKESDISPSSLILEITESLVMHDHINTVATLCKIKEEGISITVDDFGSGFSSFSYLTNFAIDKIKIDNKFIKDITVGQTEKSLVAAMISMAKALKIKTVAEGVETAEQLAILQEEQCDEVQGYYIAKPMPIDLMESFLSSKVLEGKSEKNKEQHS